MIVQDMAVIRASTPGILSTTRGYVLQQDKDIACTREFKVRHGQEQAAEELNLIVDCGGRVKNISISHRVYGRVTAEMDIRSRQDVNEFVQAINSSHSSVLSSATSGYHYHLLNPFLLIYYDVFPFPMAEVVQGNLLSLTVLRSDPAFPGWMLLSDDNDTRK